MSRTVRYDPADEEGLDDAERSVTSVGKDSKTVHVDAGESRISTQPQSPYPRVRTFARRGDRMGSTMARTFEKYRSNYLLDLPRFSTTAVASQARVDARVVCGREAPLVVEVGCGNGQQICAAAAANPDVNFLGFEVWLPGIAKAVSSAVRRYEGLPNLRLADVDALQALPILFADAPATVTELWTFFADPWPKKRHHKRRLVGTEFSQIAAELLIDGGLWRLATDWADYAWQMRDVIDAAPQFVNPYAGQRPDPEDPAGQRGGFAPRFEGRIKTAFERRAAREGRRVWDLCAQRQPREEALSSRSGTVFPGASSAERPEIPEKPVVREFSIRLPWYEEQS